jgi:hypothetical protein
MFFDVEETRVKYIKGLKGVRKDKNSKILWRKDLESSTLSFNQR